MQQCHGAKQLAEDWARGAGDLEFTAVLQPSQSRLPCENKASKFELYHEQMLYIYIFLISSPTVYFREKRKEKKTKAFFLHCEKAEFGVMADPARGAATSGGAVGTDSFTERKWN